MEQEITVGIHSGNVTFSFKTDREGSNLKEGFEAINHLISSRKELIRNATRTFPAGPPVLPREEQATISLSQLGIPTSEKDAILNHIDGLDRFELFLLLLHYTKKPLSHDQTMSLSKELGKPIRYNWLDSEPHRRERAGLVKSDRIPGKQEKLYSLTERGKRKAEEILEELRKKGRPR